MTTSRRHLTHAVMIAGLALGAWAAGEAAHQDAAHADKPPAAEQPGGLLGGAVQLPAQAADRARDAVDGVEPGPEPTESEPEPTTEPEPTKDPEPPADEPSQAPEPPADDEPTEPPAEVPPVEVPPVVVDPPPVVVDIPPVVIETPPVVIEPTPAPIPVPVPTLPVEDPPTAPTGPITLPTIPVPAVPAVPALPPLPGLPVLIGPTEPPPAGTVAQLVAALTAGVPDQLADCTDDLDAIHFDLKRITIPVNLSPHRKTTATQQPAPPCPGTPGTPDGPALTMLSVNPPPPNGQQLAADSVAGAYSRPILHRLTQLRPRGDLPAGRAEHPEPGPA